MCLVCPKQSLGRVVFGRKKASGGGSAARVWSPQSHKWLEFLSFSGLNVHIGIGGHARHLALVVEAMVRALWILNGRWRGSFFYEIPMSEGGSAGRFWSSQPPK